MGEFYVYIHLRADSGLPFYIGKGKGNRAWRVTQRSHHWNNTYKKYGLIVELLHVGLTEEQAFLREQEEIIWAKQYYSLTNKTDGGEGASKHEQTSKNKQRILDFCLQCGALPRADAEDESERRLAVLLHSYCAQSHTTFDSDFMKQVEDLGYRTRSVAKQTKIEKMKTLLRFIQEQGRPPSTRIPEERLLAVALASYCSPSSDVFDSEFSEKVLSLRRPQKRGISQIKVKEKQDSIRAFLRDHGRFPSTRIESERLLAIYLINYCTTSRQTYDPVFDAEMRAAGYGSGRGKWRPPSKPRA